MAEVRRQSANFFEHESRILHMNGLDLATVNGIN